MINQIYVSQDYLWKLYYESEIHFRYYAILSDKYRKIKLWITIIAGVLASLESFIIFYTPMDLMVLISALGLVGSLLGIFVVNSKIIDKLTISVGARIAWDKAKQQYDNLYHLILDENKIEMVKVENIQQSLIYAEIHTLTVNMIQDDKILKQAIEGTNSYLENYYEKN